VKQWMAVVVAVVAMASCANQKAPAQMALTGLESAVSAAQPEIEKFAGEQMAGITSAVAAARKKFDGGDYAGVIADVQTVTTAVTSAATAAASKKAELVTEWGSFAGLPAVVGQITAKVTELGAMKRLPKGMDKTALDGAKASLDSVNTLWTDASAAFAKGDLVAAVAKAKDVKPMIDTLMTTLGMTTAAAK
jgi:hypothetical protein